MISLVIGTSNTFKVASRLSGCNNDGRSIKDKYDATLPKFNFRARQESRFTKILFFQAVSELLRTANPGDAVIIHLSDHGVVVPIDGVNHTANLFTDSTWDDIRGTFLIDDDIKWLATQYPQQNFFITSDACESANLAFRVSGEMPGGLESRNRSAIPPPDVQMEIDHNGGVNHRAAPITLPNVAFISGTGGKGYYAADVGSPPNAYGLFTRTFCEVFQPGMSAEQIAAACRAKMPADQQPEAHGGLKNEPWVKKSA